MNLLGLWLMWKDFHSALLFRKNEEIAGKLSFEFREFVAFTSC